MLLLPQRSKKSPVKGTVHGRHKSGVTSPLIEQNEPLACEKIANQNARFLISRVVELTVITRAHVGCNTANNLRVAL